MRDRERKNNPLVFCFSSANGPVDKAYLEKTYNDWRRNFATVYLSTVQNRSSNSMRSSTSTLDIPVGNGIQWNGYSNGALDSFGTYK